jgi:ribonuclease D
MAADDVPALAERARAAGRLGLDTEFLPEGRYRPLLCLIQVAVGDQVWVLDPLAGFDTEPLAAVLADPEVEIVVHAGRQDVAILRREWGIELTRVFDTQVAAGFAGFSAQAGYSGLLHDVLRIRLSKTASFTRWDARPLTEEQLRYAEGDVENLLDLADELRRRLEATGRLEWAREECRAVEQATDERDPEEVWRRLPRATGLGPRERAVARELGAWRERTAEAENRPVGSVVRDPTLVELAKRTPASRSDLTQIRGVNPDVVRRRGDAILAAVERGLAADPIRLEESERFPTEPQDGPVIALAESLVRGRAQEAGLAYELIAARADLAPIVVAARRGLEEPDVRTLQGWRRELVGAELLELLDGRRRLGVGPGGRIAVLDQSSRASTAVSGLSENSPSTPSP